jgi:hypothetical protein
MNFFEQIFMFQETDDNNKYIQLIEQQNELLKSNIEEKRQTFSTDNQRYNYKETHLKSLTNINSLLNILYFVLFVGMSILLFVSSKISLGFYSKIILILAFAIFPFVIGLIELKIWSMLKYIFSILTGTVYN